MNLNFKLLSCLLCGFLSSSANAQNLSGFQKVDSFKLKAFDIDVYFKDPLKQVLKLYPYFNDKADQTRHELVSDYLHNNGLYIFQVSGGGKLKKSYELKGDPRKVKTAFYFNLNVFNADGSFEKTIDKVKSGGTFFEHMAIFQNDDGKRDVGKFTKIWGYFTTVEPYEKTKSNLLELIAMDIDNALPPNYLYKGQMPIEPLFEYEKCGLAIVKSRKIKTTVFQYDSLGRVTRKFPRIETDNNMYLSSVSEDIGAVTSFPLFSAADTIVTTGSRVKINSTMPNVNHYLKDVELVLSDNSTNVEKIEGKLIIHGYSANGHFTNDELYQARFAQINGCSLPKIIKYSTIDDVDFSRPRIVIEIEYSFK